MRMDTANNKPNIDARAKLTQVKISVDTKIAVSFKQACAADNVSMASKLTCFMADYSNSLMKSRDAPGYTTRRKRRAVIKRIIADLEQLKSAEERLIDNAPENLQDAPIYETADEYVSIFEDVIDQLREMVP